MSGYSDAFERAVLDLTFRGVALSVTTPIVMSLHTADPGDAAGANEVAGGGYARQPVTFSAASTDGTGVTRVVNSADVLFTNMPAVTVTHAAFWDSSTPTPKYIASFPLTAARTLQAGDQLVFPAGQISISLD
jgi:hypothetical protein